MAYLDLPGFKKLSVMPSSDIDSIDSQESGWVEEQLDAFSSKIDSRLRKRYAVPFADPAPKAVKRWLAAIVTKRCYLRLGVDPTDPQFAEISKDADEAEAEIKEAADAEGGLFELPLRQDTTTGGVSKGTPLAYSEASPYVFTSRQGSVGRDEDAAGSGSGD